MSLQWGSLLFYLCLQKMQNLKHVLHYLWAREQLQLLLWGLYERLTMPSFCFCLQRQFSMTKIPSEREVVPHYTVLKHCWHKVVFFYPNWNFPHDRAAWRWRLILLGHWHCCISVTVLHSYNNKMVKWYIELTMPYWKCVRMYSAAIHTALELVISMCCLQCGYITVQFDLIYSASLSDCILLWCKHPMNS